MLFTTGDFFEGHRITAWHGIYSAERGVVPSLTHQPDKWDAARKSILEDLAKKAPTADGILAIRFEHTQFCGNSFIFATGTAVSLSPL